MSQPPGTPPVPPPPYFHGTRNVIDIGAELRPDVVCNIPGQEDDRRMVWATSSIDDAITWSHKLGDYGPTGYVYEVELDRPEPDANASPPWDAASVMAPRGRVVRLVCSHPARGY